MRTTILSLLISATLAAMLLALAAGVAGLQPRFQASPIDLKATILLQQEPGAGSARLTDDYRIEPAHPAHLHGWEAFILPTWLSPRHAAMLLRADPRVSRIVIPEDTSEPIDIGPDGLAVPEDAAQVLAQLPDHGGRFSDCLTGSALVHAARPAWDPDLLAVGIGAPCSQRGTLLFAADANGSLYPAAFVERAFPEWLPQTESPPDGRLAWGKVPDSGGPVLPFWEVRTDDQPYLILHDGLRYPPTTNERKDEDK